MKAACIAIVGLMIAGCQSKDPTAVTRDDAPRPTSGAAPAAAPSISRGGGTIALIDGQAVSTGAMQPLLIEAAGAQVLSEIVLDRQLDRTLAERKLKVTDADIEQERQTLRRELADDRDRAARLLSELRRQRGLGDRRFALLLRRNAGLRKLIEPQTQVTDSMVRQAFEQRHGQKKVARLILVPTLVDAGKVLRRLQGGESFSDLAVEVSQDISRAQGGLLSPISPQDDSYPKGLRDAVAALQPGQISQPVSLEDGFAILRVERTIEPEAVSFDALADELRRDVRLRLQRSLMERQARVLLEGADVTVLDNALNDAWRARQAELVQPK